MIRGVGRGFIGGVWGLIMIICALAAVMVCWCCWCYGLYEKRRRRLSLAQHADSELTLREDSPKFLKLLANKENVRRNSNINFETQTPGIKSGIQWNTVEYSGSICPYPSSDPRMPSGVALPIFDD